ncbi:hypothetical protein OESDEN_06969 [Oesophagostomum dentatum]|uniref:Uncharacterized protein n=1 Tax=Oesophagostomum dentatum TaxID=61180 RepID=A0A0B1TAK2_OESDE|nr:hypothetical protein OESDEN_06969 [Oesophagostomum dentatum]
MWALSQSPWLSQFCMKMQYKCKLKDLVNHRLYKLRKKLDLFLNRLFPNKWIPLYSMVTFTRTPYHQIVEERKRQDRLTNV